MGEDEKAWEDALNNKEVAYVVARLTQRQGPFFTRIGDIEDLRQEALLAMFYCCRRFPPEGHGPGWGNLARKMVRNHLYKVATEKALVRVPRSVASRMAVCDRNNGTESLVWTYRMEDLPHDLKAKEEKTGLTDLGPYIDLLSDEEKIAVDLVFGRGQAVAASAREIGVAESTLRGRITSLLKRLRGQLSDREVSWKL